MVKDRQNDRLSYDAVFESFNLYVSALHHDVSASLRHSNGFATLLKEDAKTDPDALENWTEQIINASQKGQTILQLLTQCMRRALAANNPERITKLEEIVGRLELSSALSFDVSQDPFTDPVKLEEIYLALDKSLHMVSSAQEACTIRTVREEGRRYLRIVGTTPSTAVRETNVDRFFMPMKFDQGDFSDVRDPVVFQVKITAAALHGNATAAMTSDGLLQIEVVLPDFPDVYPETPVSAEGAETAGA